MRKNFQSIFVLLFAALVFLPAFDPLLNAETETVTYEQFLELRDEPGTVVIDSLKLEPLFHVVAPENENGISQEQLDAVLAEMIPTKDTKVVLFCDSNFVAFRTVMARDVVAWTLPQMGYNNVYKLETLWARDDLVGEMDDALSGDMKAAELGDNEVKPYAVDLPQSAQNYLDRLENTPYDSKLIQQEEVQ